MHVNIVTVRSGWILQKIAERIAAAGNRQNLTTRRDSGGTIDGKFSWSVSHAPRSDVAANYYMDIQNCYQGSTPTVDIGFFTHLHENNLKNISPHWLSLNFIVHQCTRYLEMFSTIYPEDRMTTIMPGEIPDSFHLKKPTIGIFQRGKYKGKGFHFMQEMIRKHRLILRNFRWWFVGNDWKPVIEKMKWMGISVQGTEDDTISYPGTYTAIYDSSDYVLIPSLWEGGPMSMIEAHAIGIPIIAADVGWVNKDIQVEHSFKPNDTDGLARILESIILPMALRRASVGHLSYENHAREVAKVVCKLRGMEHDIQ